MILLHNPSWWQTGGLLAQLLRPISWVWRAAGKVRCAFAKMEKLDTVIWCVGNATLGGGGKTPFCLLLGTQAKKAGINAYFLCRGYGGTLTEATLVDPKIHDAKTVGDEALLLATRLPTIASPCRLQGAKIAVSLGAELIIMDDGLQYPYLKKDLIFLMLKNAMSHNGLIFPAGPLRQPLKEAIKQSDILVSVDDETPAISGDKPIWHVMSKLHLPILEKKRVVAFAGIATPEDFKRSLENAGLELVDFLNFPDHHPYTSNDMKELMISASNYDASIITTHKDWVKLPAEYQEKVGMVDIEYQLKDFDALTNKLAELKSKTSHQ